MKRITLRLLRKSNVGGCRVPSLIHRVPTVQTFRLVSTSSDKDDIPRRRRTPFGSNDTSLFSQEDGVALLTEAYNGPDMDMFLSALKTYASTNNRKNINSELISFFLDKDGKIPSKLLSNINRENIGNVAWSLSKLHLSKATAAEDEKMREIALQLLAILSRMGSVPARQLSTSLLALSDLGLTWYRMPENDTLFIMFTLLKCINGLDATGVSNVFVALSRFGLKWRDLSAEVQQALLSRLAHKSKNAYSSSSYTMNSTHFSTVLYHMGKMGFKYQESHVVVRALIEEMICRIITSVSEVNNVLHVEQVIRTSLLGLSFVGVEYDKLKPATKEKIASIASLKLTQISPYSFASIIESMGKMKLYWCYLSAEQQASLSSLVVHHAPYMIHHEVGLTILGLGNMRAGSIVSSPTASESDREAVAAAVAAQDKQRQTMITALLKKVTQQLQGFGSEVPRLIGGFGKLGLIFSKLDPNLQQYLTFRYLAKQSKMSDESVALCLRGFGSMQLKVSGDSNRNIRFALVGSFVRLLGSSNNGAEISDAIFGFGVIEYHRLHLLPVAVIEGIEKSLRANLRKMTDVELTNTVLGLAAMQTEMSKLSPDLADLLKIVVSERTSMPSEQVTEIQAAMHKMSNVNKSIRKSAFRQQPSERLAVQVLSDNDKSDTYQTYNSFDYSDVGEEAAPAGQDVVEEEERELKM